MKHLSNERKTSFEKNRDDAENNAWFGTPRRQALLLPSQPPLKIGRLLMFDEEKGIYDVEEGTYDATDTLLYSKLVCLSIYLPYSI